MAFHANSWRKVPLFCLRILGCFLHSNWTVKKQLRPTIGILESQLSHQSSRAEFLTMYKIKPKTRLASNERRQWTSPLQRFRILQNFSLFSVCQPWFGLLKRRRDLFHQPARKGRKPIKRFSILIGCIAFQLLIPFQWFILAGYKDATSIKISKCFLNIRGLRLSSEFQFLKMSNNWNMKF